MCASNQKVEECGSTSYVEQTVENENDVYPKQGSIRLTKSKTTIIELPPMYSDEYMDPTQACGCPACMKCRDHQPIPLTPVSSPFVDLHSKTNLGEHDVGQRVMQNGGAEEVTIYEDFVEPMSSSRFKNIQGYIPPGSTAPAKR